ncbi:MAG TPA: type II secretion system protein, partial [Lacipirellulaceae bacterium]|nr:type II secretion system protein [Lacipirellulaceae bacterium]
MTLRKRRCRAITLVETLIVIAIVAILVQLLLPAVRGQGQRHVDRGRQRGVVRRRVQHRDGAPSHGRDNLRRRRAAGQGDPWPGRAVQVCRHRRENAGLARLVRRRQLAGRLRGRDGVAQPPQLIAPRGAI